MARSNVGASARDGGIWRFVALLVAAVVVPLLTFVGVASLDRAAVMADAARESEDVAEIAAQHALALLQTHELVARLVSEHIAGMSWDEISTSKPVHEFLARLDETYPQTRGIWLADRSGMIRGASAVFPMRPVSIADRDYFVALRAGAPGTVIGEMVINRVIGEPNFNVARRRLTATGDFDGLVVVSVAQKPLATFWHAISPRPGSVTALVRSDGMILARQPELRPDATRLPPTSLVRRAVVAGVEQGFFREISPIDRMERFYALRRIGSSGMYVIHGTAVSTALARWYADLRLFGMFFAVGAAALVLTAAAALRQARREHTATLKWRAAAQRADEELRRRESVEEQLRQSQKLEALGQMAGGIAHDFGNVLLVVMGNLEGLQGRQQDARMERKVNVALAAAERAAQVIRSLLAFARRQQLNPQFCEPARLLEQAKPLLQQAIGSRNRLVLEVAGDAWPIRVDANQLEMAVLNLAVNARDAMPDGGTLRIAAGNTRLRGDPGGLTGEFLRIAVADTGSGMPPETAARAFDPFFTTKPPGKGTGLGLSQVYGFATQCGGIATLDSAQGAGTTVTLYLPRAPRGREGGGMLPENAATPAMSMG